MTSSNRLITCLILSCTLLISSCGWQLRGYHSANLSISSIALDTQKINNPTFIKVFKDTLASEYKIQIDSTSPVKAMITRVSERKRVSSKDRDGDTSEYEHTITLSVTTAVEEKTKPLTQNFISIRRQSYDEDNLLSSDMQERAAKLETYQELTRQYASYLSRQLANDQETN